MTRAVWLMALSAGLAIGLLIWRQGRPPASPDGLDAPVAAGSPDKLDSQGQSSGGGADVPAGEVVAPRTAYDIAAADQAAPDPAPDPEVVYTGWQADPIQGTTDKATSLKLSDDHHHLAPRGGVAGPLASGGIVQKIDVVTDPGGYVVPVNLPPPRPVLPPQPAPPPPPPTWSPIPRY